MHEVNTSKRSFIFDLPTSEIRYQLPPTDQNKMLQQLLFLFLPLPFEQH